MVHGFRERKSGIWNLPKTLWTIWFGDFSAVDRKALILEILASS